MSVYEKKGSSYWHYDFQVNGVRFSGSTKAKSKREARLVEARIRAEAIAEQDGGKRTLPLTTALARYYDEVAKHQSSEADTLRQLGYLEDVFGAQTPLPSITNNEITLYVARRRASVSNATVNREVELMRRVWRRAANLWNVDIGEMPNWSALLLPEPEWRTRELLPDEETVLYDTIREDAHNLIDFCLVTGVRKSQALFLKWDQVDLQGARVRVRKKTKKPGDHWHVVPLPRHIVVMLANMRSHHPESVFTYVCQKTRGARKRGQRYPWTKSGWNSAWKRAIKKSGIEDFKFHDLRHTAATRFQRETGNLNTTKELLGHSSITMTQRYAHATKDDVLAGMERVANSRRIPADQSGEEANALGKKAKSK